MNSGGKTLNLCSSPWWVDLATAAGPNPADGVEPPETVPAQDQAPPADAAGNSAATALTLSAPEDHAPWWTQRYFKTAIETSKHGAETEIDDAISRLLDDVARHKGHQPQFRMPTADPGSVAFEKGRAVWVTKTLLTEQGRSLIRGYYRFLLDQEGNQYVGNLRGCYPLTPEIMAVLAPVTDLQKEAVEALPRGIGWKLHLNFDYTDAAIVKKIRTLLEAMKQRGIIDTYKIGCGGGKDCDQPGKEATVYIGHGYKAKKVAEFLERHYSHLLLAPEGDALIDDILLNPMIAARFDLTKSPAECEFNQYGWHGVPFVHGDGRPHSPRRDEAAREYAYKVLAERFGEFFTDGFVGSRRP
ncbi:MAG: hypothetical protein WC956_10400 [bacterium]